MALTQQARSSSMAGGRGARLLPGWVASSSSLAWGRCLASGGRRPHNPIRGRLLAPCSSSGSSGSSGSASAKPSVYSAAPVARGAAAKTPGFDSIEDALQDLRAGKFVVVLDDEDRENEGDLIINADKMTAASMAFMVEHTSGVVCISMEAHDLERLRLPLMVTSADNNESMSTAFTITVDLSPGCTTGISAADRTATIRAMADPRSTPDLFRRPGHIFPLRYRPGGVLARPGHTEAALDLARLSGSYPAGVLCEIVDRRDGSMARTPQLLAFAAEHGLRAITIADLVAHRLRREQLLEPAGASDIDTRAGPFALHCFRSSVDGREHAALVARGSSSSSGGSGSGSGSGSGGGETGPVPVRLQLQNQLVDVFGSTHCGHHASDLDTAMAAASAAGSGVILYVSSCSSRSGGGGSSSLSGQLSAYAEQQQACGTRGGEDEAPPPPASSDLRDYAAAAHMLRHLGVTQVQLLGHSEADARTLAGFGIAVAGCTPWPPAPPKPSHPSSSPPRQQQQQQQQQPGGPSLLPNGHAHAAASSSSSSSSSSCSIASMLAQHSNGAAQLTGAGAGQWQ